MAAAKGVKLSTELKGLTAMGDDWIQRLVEASELALDEPRIDPGWFHPSSLSTPCDANLAFMFLGTAPKANRFPPRTLRIFDNGHGRDEAWKRYNQRAGISLVLDAQGEPVQSDKDRKCATCGGKDYDGRHICIPELRIRGDFDDFVVNPVTGETGIFEFKTKKHDLFEALHQPDPGYITLVMPYMVAKQQTMCWQVYECKDDQELKSFVIPFDPDAWQAIVDRLTRIIQTLGNGGSPMRGCRYACPFEECANADFPMLVEAYRQRQGLA